MSATVRRAEPHDIDALVATRVALFRETGEDADAGAASFTSACRAALVPLLESGTAIAWLGHVGSDAVGSCVLLVFPRLPSPTNLASREGYILSVWVAREQRRLGLATALVEAALDESRRLQLGRVRLHATPAGHAVYERLGFRARSDEMELILARPEQR